MYIARGEVEILVMKVGTNTYIIAHSSRTPCSCQCYNIGDTYLYMCTYKRIGALPRVMF